MAIVAAALALYFGYAALRADAAFPGVSGPATHSQVRSAPAPARWQDYDTGGPARLAILLTDPDSSWLGLVQGLKSIGIPFRITRDWRQALHHRVVLVYPTISGKVLEPDALQALAAFPASGGTLIGTQVEGGGMDRVFGFSEAQPSRKRRSMTLDAQQALTQAFDDPRERTIPFSNPAQGAQAMGSLGYTGADGALARFDDGSAAITARQAGAGHAYALGLDPGFLFQTGYNNREEGVSRSYVNGYEPVIDVWLRLLRAMYRQGEPTAVTLDTVPQGKSLAVVLTHDIDYGSSLQNSPAYARYEASQGIRATYFIQTKYVRDWNDDVFYDRSSQKILQSLDELHMEVASHSVAHSRSFNSMSLGTGDEQYPGYHPFVRSREVTEKASILGELRVSRFLLEHLLPGQQQVVSFRPGHLRSPYALPQALEATGYRYSSSVTANNSLTHLPFQLSYGRESSALAPVFEFPVTIEDEEEPRLGDRLQPALALAERLSRYGGLMVVLIHPNILDHKLDFEQRLVTALRTRAWFGAIDQMGEFWAARDRLAVDVKPEGARLRLDVTAPLPVAGLSLQLPAGYRLAATDRTEVEASSTQPGKLVLGRIEGSISLTLEK